MVIIFLLIETLRETTEYYYYYSTSSYSSDPASFSGDSRSYASQETVPFESGEGTAEYLSGYDMPTFLSRNASRRLERMGSDGVKRKKKSSSNLAADRERQQKTFKVTPGPASRLSIKKGRGSTGRGVYVRQRSTSCGTHDIDIFDAYLEKIGAGEFDFFFSF